MRYWMPLLAAVICLLGLTLTVGTYAAAEVPAANETVQVAQLDARLMAPAGALGAEAGLAATPASGTGDDEENHPGLLIAAGVLALWSLRRRLV